jgi:hypothetical protein
MEVDGSGWWLLWVCRVVCVRGCRSFGVVVVVVDDEEAWERFGCVLGDAARPVSRGYLTPFLPISDMG